MQLGASAPADTTDPFGWLACLPQYERCKLLLVFDQMDDYLIIHQQYLVSSSQVIASSQLIKINPDWATLAQLLRDNRIHILLVCRAETVATLNALRFTENVGTYLLPRLEEHLLAPLLDELTNTSENEVGVVDPDYGWVQLKSRLLRDVSSGGQVLPIQLAVALNSLRRLRYLNLTSG
jgi:hypothetical protein